LGREFGRGDSEDLSKDDRIIQKLHYKIIAFGTPEESDICSPGCNETEPGVE